MSDSSDLGDHSPSVLDSEGCSHSGTSVVKAARRDTWFGIGCMLLEFEHSLLRSIVAVQMDC